MIAHEVTHRSKREILDKISAKQKTEENQVLTVFNSLPYERNEYVELFVEFPQEAKVKDFRIEDMSGKEVPFQVLSKESLYGVTESGDVGYWACFVDRYRIVLLADHIPPMGYKCFRIVPGKSLLPVPQRSLARDGNGMENEFLKVSIGKNGTIAMTDKVNRRTYKNLHYFEDGGDAGDPWNYVRPRNDLLVNTLKSRARVSLVEDTPYSCAYRVEVEMKVPAELDL